ncbi:uncharacterized protein TNCV_4640151 [Trichonephila clavipes]|nr:uncharacterized protein TNCV_4640151 [Trichonephila clavipes]
MDSALDFYSKGRGQGFPASKEEKERERGEIKLNATDQFTCRNCGGGDRGGVTIVPSGNFAELNRTVTCMVLKANDSRTSCPCHDEFRGPRSDYVRQVASENNNNNINNDLTTDLKLCNSLPNAPVLHVCKPMWCNGEREETGNK